MREILFRGKITDNGEWVYGIPVECVTNCYEKSTRIITEYTEDELNNFYPSLDYESVFADTVGQYTGLKDKNGKKIFEGDVVTIDDYITLSEYDGRKFIVKYVECEFFAEPIGHPEQAIRLYNECAEYEVIGNISDNPELLGGDNK